jgi:hypothetical protein
VEVIGSNPIAPTITKLGIYGICGVVLMFRVSLGHYQPYRFTFLTNVHWFLCYGFFPR